MDMNITAEAVSPDLKALRVNGARLWQSLMALAHLSSC